MSCLFSIITVCYNSAKTITQTIESVLNQTYQDFEYIIVDGGSTDGTIELIKKYEPLFAGRLKWISEPDKGIYDAMNKGIRMASGELIGIINSDDWYEITALELIAEKKTEICTEFCVYYGLMRNYKDGKLNLIGAYTHEMLSDVMIPHSTCFVSKVTYEKFGYFDTNYRLASDYELMLRLYTNNVTFLLQQNVLANFTYGGITDKKKLKSMLETYKIQRKYKTINVVKFIRLCLFEYARHLLLILKHGLLK